MDIQEIADEFGTTTEHIKEVLDRVKKRGYYNEFSERVMSDTQHVIEHLQGKIPDNELQEYIDDMIATRVFQGVKDEGVIGMSEQQAAGRTKDSKDYLRVDLKPNGVDLKSYVVKQASLESVKQGRAISATKYIQGLIEADMKAHAGKKDKRREIADMLNHVDDNDLQAIEKVVKAMCK